MRAEMFVTKRYTDKKNGKQIYVEWKAVDHVSHNSNVTKHYLRDRLTTDLFIVASNKTLTK